jgi:hypothetical protein
MLERDHEGASSDARISKDMRQGGTRLTITHMMLNRVASEGEPETTRLFDMDIDQGPEPPPLPSSPPSAPIAYPFHARVVMHDPVCHNGNKTLTCRPALAL